MLSKAVALLKVLMALAYNTMFIIGQFILVATLARITTIAVISLIPYTPRLGLWILLTSSMLIISEGALRIFDWILPELAELLDKMLANSPPSHPSEKEESTSEETRKQPSTIRKTGLFIGFFIVSMTAVFAAMQSHRDDISRSSDLVRFDFDVMLTYKDPDQNMHLRDISITRCGRRDWINTEPLLSEDVKSVIRKSLQEERGYKDDNIVFISAYETTSKEKVESCNNSNK